MRSRIPALAPISVGVETPAAGSSGWLVGVATVIFVGVGVVGALVTVGVAVTGGCVIVGVGVGVGVWVGGVLVGIAVGVVVGMARVNEITLHAVDSQTPLLQYSPVAQT